MSEGQNVEQTSGYTYPSGEAQPFSLPANPSHEKKLKDQHAAAQHQPPHSKPNTSQGKDMKAPSMGLD